MIVLIILAAIMLIMGIIILMGKGDNLIAGYNTASKEEERSQYYIKRLRGLIGGFLLILAPMMVLLLGGESLVAGFSFIAFTFVLCIVLAILANTWAKKKNS